MARVAWRRTAGGPAASLLVWPMLGLLVMFAGAQPGAGDGSAARSGALATVAEDNHSAAADQSDAPAMTMAMFLDRLMLAESGGRDTARNPRSSAAGPFQFITTTFIAVVRRHFHDETAKHTDAEVLAMRSDRAFARRAAEVFTRDNAASLTAAGHPATFPNLRLAFLLGADGAIRVLAAKADVKVAEVVGPRVIAANPFMQPLTAGQLVARAARDLALTPAAAAGAGALRVTPSASKPAPPRIAVRCKLSLASCRQWLSLQQRKAARKAVRQAKR